MKILKPIPFKIPKSDRHALRVQVDEMAFFYNQLHYHPEYQVTAVVRGDGILYAGNNMVTFAEGDVFLIGSNVPHLFQCSGIYHSEDSPGVKGISLFFDQYSFGRQFFEIREMQSVKGLLQASTRVLKVAAPEAAEVHPMITGTVELKEESLIIAFLQILSSIGKVPGEFLNSEQYRPLLDLDEGGRLNEVLNYTFSNFRSEITIEQIAKVALLSRSQFSYFFKLHTGKTYIRFLNDLRIENACILLRSNNHTIETICYEVGFQNVSNFVRQFKKAKATTPSAYRKLWRIP